MKMLIRASLLLTIVVLWVSSVVPLSATTIFDNSVNDLQYRFNPGTVEVGDEILLAGTERFLTSFSFEYWGANTLSTTTFAGDVQARVRFYENAGALYHGYDTPSVTPFWDSGWFGGFGPTDVEPFRATLVFTAGVGLDFPEGGLLLPVTSNMTWSVQFQGMGATDTVGVDIYSAPVVGQDYPDYWQNNGGWTLLTNTVRPMDFAARMEATVPEPSTLTLSILGGLSILALTRRLRRTE